MSAIGSRMGRLAQKMDGRAASGRSTVARNSASVVPGVSRIGTASRALSHRQTHQPVASGTSPTRMPARMDAPTSSFRFSTIASGPGCGTVIECVMTPPPQRAMT